MIIIIKILINHKNFYFMCHQKKKSMNKELYETTQIRIFLCGKVSKVTKSYS